MIPIGTAVFSPDRIYRYMLTRQVNALEKRTVGFGLLNPSTAGASRNDQTVSKLTGFARRWGFGWMVLFNAFAYRATDPRDLYRVEDPVGPDNANAIASVAETCDQVVVGWGNHGSHLERGAQVLAQLAEGGIDEVHCWGKTQTGQPKHPLYLAYDTELGVV